jgi:RNA recognition motif-containing protein
MGVLKKCIFDRNEFGNFLGSATVVYENAEDAQKAITEYHGAFLDDKVLTVEFDSPKERLPRVSRP